MDSKIRLLVGRNPKHRELISSLASKNFCLLKTWVVFYMMLYNKITYNCHTIGIHLVRRLDPLDMLLFQLMSLSNSTDCRKCSEYNFWGCRSIIDSSGRVIILHLQLNRSYMRLRIGQTTVGNSANIYYATYWKFVHNIKKCLLMYQQIWFHKKDEHHRKQ